MSTIPAQPKTKFEEWTPQNEPKNQTHHSLGTWSVFWSEFVKILVIIQSNVLL